MAFYACLYFAALRPAEVVGLRLQDCHLPQRGWGRLTLEKSRPEVNRRWTDPGDAGRVQLSSRRLEVRALAGADHDSRAGFAECVRHLQPEPTGPSGDERATPGENEQLRDGAGRHQDCSGSIWFVI